jgi:uncharacterized protein YndB with AHSA1/START domain
MNDIHERPDDDIVVECDLDAAPDKVWRALTVRELAARWLDLSDGADAAGYEVVEALPHSRVRYAWRDQSTDAPDTVVTIDLSPLPEGRTRFRLTHGIAAPAPLMAANINRPPMARAA